MLQLNGFFWPPTDQCCGLHDGGNRYNSAGPRRQIRDPENTLGCARSPGRGDLPDRQCFLGGCRRL